MNRYDRYSYSDDELDLFAEDEAARDEGERAYVEEQKKLHGDDPYDDFDGPRTGSTWVRRLEDEQWSQH